MPAIDSDLSAPSDAAPLGAAASVVASSDPTSAAPEIVGDALDPAVAVLCQPISEEDPCGPDLDIEGDAAYLNFFALAEGILPSTFFSVEDGRPFDRSTVDFKQQFETLRPLTARTRDLRLLVLQARLCILNKDIAGFAVSVAAIAQWLDTHWDAVHPREQGGDFAARSAAIGMLDVPTVIFPLQYAPLFEVRRLGSITYRGLMIARAEVNAREGESKQAVSLFTEALNDANPADLAAIRKNLALLRTSLVRIRDAFSAHGLSAGLDNLPPLVGKIISYVDPAAAVAISNAATGADGGAQSAAGAAGPAPKSLADASAALSAIADYYSASEPSSPVLPLVRQAHQLIGKSFVEIMNILVPMHLEQAAFQIGNGQIFELPVGKLSELSAVAPAMTNSQPTDGSEPSDAAPAEYRITSRSQAVALLDLIQRFFRQSEPSSPVPMLCERARSMAERDFMGLLQDVLPKSALKNAGANE